MADELRHSDREDPFRDFSALSLFPRTLGVALHAEAATSESHELDSIQNLFKSMALKGSTKLLEQAHVISKSYRNIPNLYSEAKDKAAIASSKDAKDRPQGRRPALGRKRAQFSLKPMSSHSLPTIDFNSSIDYIEDPEEYFLAFEQLENAEKELKKLRGEVAADLMQNQRSTAARERRPGILGKKASFKDRFSVNADTIEAFRVPKEVIPDRRIASPSNTLSIAESSIYTHPEATEQPGISNATGIHRELLDDTEREGSVANKEKTVQDLLEKLLSSFKDLDGGDGEALLRKSLQIKSLNVGKMCLTELNSTQRNDRRPLDNEVTNKLAGPQLPYMASTHTRSPLAVISTLQRRILMKNPLKDPYSMPPSDDAPPSGDFYTSMGRDKQYCLPSADIDHHSGSGLIDDGASTPVTVNRKRSTFKDKMHLPVLEPDKTIRNKITSEEELTKPCSHENSADYNSSGFNNHGHDASTGLDGCLEEEGNNKQPDALIFGQPDLEVEDLPSGYVNQNITEGLASSPSTNKDQTLNSSGHDIDSGIGPHVILQGEVSVMAEGEPVSGPEISKDNSSPSRIILPVEGHSENLCILPVEKDETQRLQEASGVSPNRGQKKRSPEKHQNRQKTSKRKKLTSKRQSLAAAGLTWESGVRRSTRIKSRPLEYWRGERFLYGRIHDSLATVIGVKYASPVKDAKAPAVLKVKSFVPEKYAYLVAQAAS